MIFIGFVFTVTYIGKGGYWEGRVGNVEGWFPRLAIKEVGEEQYDYPSKNSELVTILVSSGNSEFVIRVDHLRLIESSLSYDCTAV